MTPVAASSPNALPPDKHDGVHHLDGVVRRQHIRFPGARRAAAHVHAADRARRRSTTVQPVGRSVSVKWPTRTPGTAVMPGGEASARRPQVHCAAATAAGSPRLTRSTRADLESIIRPSTPVRSGPT